MFSSRCWSRSIAAILPVLIITAFGHAGDLPTQNANGEQPAFVLPPQDDELEFEVADIFAESCAFAGCHSGPTAPKGLDLSEGVFKSNLINVKSQDKPEFVLVKPGDAAKSYLIGKIRGTSNIAGDRMPRSGEPLPKEDVAIIVKWINSLPAGMQVEAPQREYAMAFPGLTLTNIPTAETLPTGAFLYRIAHKFRSPVSDGFDRLFGLDGGSFAMLELAFPLTDDLTTSVKRSGSNATFELLGKWRFLREKTDGSMPFSLALQAGVDWQTLKEIPDPANLAAGNLSRTDGERFSYFVQAPITKSLGSKLSFVVVPGVLFNGNVQQTDEDALVTLALGGKFSFNRKYGLFAEIVPILSGEDTALPVGGRRIESGGTRVFNDTFTAGLEIFVGGHIFHIFVSNSAGNTTNQYLSGANFDFADGDYRLGFNIYRILNYPF